MSIQVLKRLFTATEYHQMVETGILSEDDHLELIKGEIVEMSPIGSRHAACVNRLNQLLGQNLAQRALISVQNPIYLNDHSEPQPDISLLRTRSDFYAGAHPKPEDVLLIIEVAETSVDYDREVKIPLYAQSGIVEVWLVDLAGEIIEVYRRPVSTGFYQQVTEVRRGQGLASQVFPDTELAVDEVLG